ncbi:hypothetical protein [Streptomyces sp. NPDC004100]
MTDQQTLPATDEQPERQPVPFPAETVTPRPRLRAALRWVAAVAVFAITGTGTAYGITLMDRTDVPGLATRSDGRWDYPELVKPPLPSGSPGPAAAANKAGAHYADLRALVLPAPRGATPDPALKGDDGWVTTKDFLAPYTEASRPALRQKLVDYGLRHVAARGWTTPDGTRTRVYLLQFDTAAVAEGLLNKDLVSYSGPRFPLTGAASFNQEDDFVGPTVKGVTPVYFTEVKPYGKEQLRMAYLGAGDTIAMITQSRKGVARAVPFWQTLTLQSELLG